VRERPNILLITTDQQRYDSLGCYGLECVKTPNLDRLAEEGVLYTNCYVNNPVCTPSRASIMTGKHLNGHGVYRLHDILPEDEVMFPSRLRQKGYHTALFGKLHVSGRSFEREKRHRNDGFDIYRYAMVPHRTDGTFNSYGEWLRTNRRGFYDKLNALGRQVGNIPVDSHFTHWAAEMTIDFLRARERDAPFFCMMSVIDPHDPYSDYPLEMRELVDEDRIPEPVVDEGESHRKPKDIIRAHEHSYLGSFHDFSLQQIREMRLGYYASIALIDLEVGRVLDVLDREGLRDNTLVIFTSDHGDMLGDHELLAKGPFFYDACTKVPLIMRHPVQIEPGTRIEELVQPHDLGATVLGLAGFKAEEIKDFMPDSLDLVSLLNREGSANYRDHAVCLFRNTMIDDRKLYFDPPIYATMYRSKRYKLNAYHEPDLGSHEYQGELFDMLEDPRELNNLWDHPDIARTKQELLGALTNWLVGSDMMYHAGRGGEVFPPKSQWSLNNPL